MAPTLTARDVEILAMVFQCFKDPEAAKVDYQKLAELGGFNGARSATAAWSSLKKKLLAGATAEAVTPKSTKAKGAKVNADDDAEDEDEDKDDTTLTKATVKKPRARKPKAVVQAEEETASSPAHGGDYALLESADDTVHRKGTRYHRAGDASSPEVEAAPKKRAPKAAKVAATNEDGSPVKKRARKADAANTEPKPAAKRAKKAATVKEEPVDEKVSGFGLPIVPGPIPMNAYRSGLPIVPGPIPMNVYGSGYVGDGGQATQSGGFTPINRKTEEDVLGVHPGDDDQTLPPS